MTRLVQFCPHCGRRYPKSQVVHDDAEDAVLKCRECKATIVWGNTSW